MTSNTNRYQSDVIAYTAIVLTTLSAEHEHLLKAKMNILRAALMSVFITLATLVAAVVMAVLDPTALSLYVLLSLMSQKATWLGLASGSLAAGLFRQYNKLNKRTVEVSTNLSDVHKLMLAFIASESMELSEHRDKARSRLVNKLVRLQSTSPRRGSLSDTLRSILSPAKDSKPSLLG